ncbi:MAG: DNA mismatch repair endonuclease MutL [Clostridiales bacterium]|nr:DNA mismatch repair endonuclease MutL [Clostridiales bacterium]
MGKINILSFEVANLIAAGEVVDRPASVVKELMENSIDAGADRITVEIQNGGTTFIRVSDNGCGIGKDDLPVAVRRHATSKIKEAEDLECIMSLGFRGEALAAIAAVSDLRIISRVRGEAIGAAIEVSGGDILGVFERGCSEGTTVIVENLFYNVPARRKFLKRDITETAAVTAAVEKIALSHPEVAVHFIVDGTTRAETPGDGVLLNTIYALFGRQFALGLLEVSYEYEGIKVTGYTGRSDNCKPTRNWQNFFINRRYVKSKTIAAALEQAYSSYIAPERFPVCVLFVGINPRTVDVNVHPAKLEVKFSNEKPVFEAVYYAIKNTLEHNTTRPGLDPAKFGQITYEEYRRAFAPENSDKAPQKSGDGRAAENESEAARHDRSEAADDNSTARQAAGQESEQQPEAAPVSKPIILTAEDYIEEFRDTEDEKISDESGGTSTTVKESESGTVGHADGVKESAQPSGGSEAELRLPVQNYRIVGEAFNSYVIVDTGDKMLLVDKHAAHERIIFEKLKAGMKSAGISSQTIMPPLEFMLTSEETLALLEYREEIESLGFSFTAEKFTVTVTAFPDAVELSAVPDIFMTIADRIRNGTGTPGLTRDILFEKALYQAACKAAIKAGQEYGPEHIRWLVDQLMSLPDITFCPHGRPVAMEITKSSLDRQFGRT